MQKRKEFEKLLVDGAEAAATKNASRVAIDQEGEQLEGGNTEGPKGMQQAVLTSNIEHPLYLASEIAGNECDDDLGENENDGWKNVMNRYEDNTVK